YGYWDIRRTGEAVKIANPLLISVHQLLYVFLVPYQSNPARFARDLIGKGLMWDGGSLSSLLLHVPVPLVVALTAELRIFELPLPPSTHPLYQV
ncbi:MAG: hypothetical protein ACLFO5_00425, partial [Opitutales bacterium]